MRIRVCWYKNAGVAGYAEAFRPVQSDSQTSEWYSYFENDVPDTKKSCRNICRVELICYIWSINECLISYIKSSEMDHHLRALILHSFIQKSTVLSSSSIQTVLSAPESHRIMPFGSRALPPVGNHTLPWRFSIQLRWKYSTAAGGLQGHFANRDKTGTARLLGREVKYMLFALRLRL